MTDHDFTQWLADMKSAGLAVTDAECGRLLGKTPHGILWIKKHGTDRTVALACAALLAGLEPYGDDADHHPALKPSIEKK